ncbi:hypothetical protein CPC08DRAFT_711882 [Agrocybe pediades]|nr:hypothetical protein CPC08DRAFT_711882 [Agrocybe pediades]
MHRNGHQLLASQTELTLTTESHPASPPRATAQRPPLVWDWTIEHEDRKKERKADAALHGATPFEVDRKILKDVVREKMGVEAGRIQFLSAGTFHKAYLITLADHSQLVARVARRFMPRLKTESEVATIDYIRNKTNIPVSEIYHYDSNPYNRLGGEFILMSKAPGIPLSQVYHGLPYNELVKLLKNVAVLIIPLFAHRFNAIGSLYFGPDPRAISATSGAPTPKAALDHYTAFPFSPTLEMANFLPSITPRASSAVVPNVKSVTREHHVGPIISWPFFGSNRGELTHPHELNRGPWPTTESYLKSCVDREIQGVILENEGKTAPHRLHLDPDEVQSSRHHRLRAVPGDESDDSDEWNLEESEDEWEGPGDAMYRDYRRMQRSTFLIAHLTRREEIVKKEMSRWMQLMDKLRALIKKPEGPEEFGLDCHDLSLENVFVDEKDSTTITAIIDWESTTTRPLWQCAHVPAFLQSSPFLTKLFREVVSQLPNDPIASSIMLPKECKSDLRTLCDEWLYYEAHGTRLRLAHRCAEWDGWEEGLVDSILGPEEYESEWFKGLICGKDSGKDGEEGGSSSRAMVSSPGVGHEDQCGLLSGILSPAPTTKRNGGLPNGRGGGGVGGVVGLGAGRGVKMSSKLPILQEQEKEQMLTTTGDFCGGRGGELGRRLEAWLTVSGSLSDNSEKAWESSEGGEERLLSA